MRVKSTQRINKDTLNLIIKHLKDDDKTFIEMGTLEISKDIHGELLSQAYTVYISNKENEILLIKFCSILTYLCAANDKTVKEIIVNINNCDINNNLTETDVYKYNGLNNRFASAFKSNRQVFELFKYILKNKIYNSTSIMYYWDWMNKNHVFDTLDVNEAMHKVENGGKLSDILKYTDAKIQCIKCGGVKHITLMKPGKNICKNCEKIEDARRNKGEQGVKRYIEAKKSKEISDQLESKIEQFKSTEQTFSTEIEHSRDYLMYEAMYSTIINNLYDIIDLDIQNLSDSEKEVIKSNNKQITKLLKEVEAKTWE